MLDAFRVGRPAGSSPLDALLADATPMAKRVLGEIRSTLADSAESKADPETEPEAVLADALALAVAMVCDAAGSAHEAEQRARWALAAASMSTRVLRGDGQRPLDHVTRCAVRAADADFASLALFTDPGLLRVRAVSGELAGDLVGTCPDLAGSLTGQVAGTGEAVLAEAYPEAGVRGPVAVVPMRRGGEVIGVLAVGRVEGGRPFTPVDLGNLGDYAAHTAEVVEFAWSGALRHRLAESEDAACELTDQVVGDLFAVGLGLRGIIATTTSSAQRGRLTRYVDSIATAAARVRDFFGAQAAVPLSLRLLATIDASEVTTGSPIRVSIAGSVNREVPADLADDVIVVVRDALGTVSHAELVELRVDFDGGACTVEVVDDGVASLARSRLVAQLRERAHHRRSVRQERSSDDRNRLTWTSRVR